MAFKPINTQATDIKKHLDKPFTGEYKGYSKITTKIGEQLVYNFVDEAGVPFAIYGFTNLNRTMEHIDAGAILRITYKGTVNVQTKFGMKDVHQVLVELDDDSEPQKESVIDETLDKDNSLPF